jgi:hypothetical protein
VEISQVQAHPILNQFEAYAAFELLAGFRLQRIACQREFRFAL